MAFNHTTSPPVTLRSFWQGRQPLWKAFWLLYVAGTLLLGMAAGQITVLFISSEWAQQLEQWFTWQNLYYLLATAAVIYLAYFVLCFVAVWRSAAQHPDVIERWAARAVILIHAVWSAIQTGVMVLLLAGGGMRWLDIA